MPKSKSCSICGGKAKRAAYLAKNADKFEGFDWEAYRTRQALPVEGAHHG